MSMMFNPDAIVIDINGPGAGLADYLIDDQDEGGTYYPAFNFINKSKYSGTEKKGGKKILYGIEADSSMNSKIATLIKTYLSLSRISLLIDERQARRHFNQYKMWQKMSVVKQANRLIPYSLTTKLHDQLTNLKGDVDTNGSIKLNRIRSSMKKDLVSALGYGLYYIDEKEEKARKKGNIDGSLSNFHFFNTSRNNSRGGR